MLLVPISAHFDIELVESMWQNRLQTSQKQNCVLKFIHVWWDLFFTSTSHWNRAKNSPGYTFRCFTIQCTPCFFLRERRKVNLKCFLILFSTQMSGIFFYFISGSTLERIKYTEKPFPLADAYVFRLFTTYR